MSQTFVHAHCISYGALCERAGYPCLPHFAGRYLGEIAGWCCNEHGWPPIHALAVNVDSKIPGHGYDEAPGGGFAEWEDQVRKVIAFKGYPEYMPK